MVEMQLYFIRHGQSTNNALPDDFEDRASRNRSEDPELTQKGLRQAELTGDALAFKNSALSVPHTPYGDADFQNRLGFGLTHLYCGLMVRAVHTGTIIGNRLGLPLLAHLDMHECGGIYLNKEVDNQKVIEILHGKGAAWLGRHYPDLQFVTPISDDGWWPGGKEDYPPRIERAFRVIEFLKNRHAGTNDRVGIITHGSFFAVLFRALFKLDLHVLRSGDQPYRLVYNNCGITRIDIENTRYFELVYLNRTCHLPDELIT
jgi:2,3-bisphosphoglycerate-dependent phosphoglycerate mutase